MLTRLEILDRLRVAGLARAARPPRSDFPSVPEILMKHRGWTKEDVDRGWKEVPSGLMEPDRLSRLAGYWFRA